MSIKIKLPVKKFDSHNQGFLYLKRRWGSAVTIHMPTDDVITGMVKQTYVNREGLLIDEDQHKKLAPENKELFVCLGYINPELQSRTGDLKEEKKVLASTVE